MPKKEEPEASQAEEPGEKPKKQRHMSWAKLLQRVFAIDMSHCRSCGGEMKIIAAIMGGAEIEKILKHVGLPHKPPDVAPARYFVQKPLF